MTEKIQFFALFLSLLFASNQLNLVESALFKYELNTFDSKELKCKTVLNFNHSSSELDLVFLNDDESNQYQKYTGCTNSIHKIMIAVRNYSELILITKQNDSIQNDIVIKV